MTTYAEKLKNPRWQKMRLLILNRDKFRCKFCGNKEKTLNVHHIYYKKDCDPWDYPETLLITLCEDCHKTINDIDIKGFIFDWIFKGCNPKLLL